MVEEGAHRLDGLSGIAAEFGRRVSRYVDPGQREAPRF